MQQPLDVIFEDNHLLVVNKPALLPTMGAAKDQDSLFTIAKDYLKEKYDKPGNVYLGVVSRLDSFVSGVVVLARTSKAAARLNEQFANSCPQKKYWAIVPSELCHDQKELEHWLVKDDAQHRMKSVGRQRAEQKGAKQAKLSYRRIGRFNDRSLLEILLYTGRKHQIRVQMAACGHPIIGDKKYGSEIGFRTGIALHSRSLTIQHPTQKKDLTFSQDPPVWWQVQRYLTTE